MRLLIVDDSATSRMLLENILRHCGYTDLILAETAIEAIDHLRETYEHVNNAPDDDDTIKPDPVDLILMDLNMPHMNGIEATWAIKSDPRFADIPIILVTVSDELENLERAFEAGAIDYINKPLNKVELRARVRSVLKLKQETDRRKARERELEALTRKLEDLSNLDGLTGVANRRHFDNIYPNEWLRCRRERTHISMLMIDIDFFKLYNDTYGHLQGDTCLKKVATAIKNALRRPADMVARFGGEEFVVMLPCTELDGAKQIADSIRSNVLDLRMEHSTSEVGSLITVSIGLTSCVPNNNGDPMLLIHAADTALYEAKRQGRDRIVIGSCIMESN